MASDQLEPKFTSDRQNQGGKTVTRAVDLWPLVPLSPGTPFWASH
ncbi:hypothetical protein ARSEF1564_007085 [Beauveria bassiana]